MSKFSNETNILTAVLFSEKNVFSKAASFINKMLMSVLFFSLTFLSCSIISFEELSISSNISTNETYFSENEISLTFSITPDYDTAEKLITLKEDSSTIELTFTWNNNTCKIKPVSDFKKNARYILQLNGNLSTKDNRTYETNFLRTFIYGTQDDYFVLASFENPDVGTNTETITLTFNKPVNISNFEDNFSINPHISTERTYSSDKKTITISPETKWPVNTYFTWNIKKLTSEENYETRREYSQTFCYIHDYLQPGLVSSNLNDRKITDTLSFTFNKIINLQSFEKYFSITPYIKGYYTQEETTITFHPLSNFEIKKEYTIQFSQKITDENSIPLYKDIYKTFIPTNDFLKIQSISINEIQNIALSEDLEISSTTLNSQTTTTTNTTPQINITNTDTLFIEIIFSKPISKDKLTSAEKAITLEAQFPPDVSYPKLTSLNWNTDKTKLSMTYSNISKSYQDVLYKLTVNSSKTYFLTEDEEYMEKDTCVHFKTHLN